MPIQEGFVLDCSITMAWCFDDGEEIGAGSLNLGKRADTIYPLPRRPSPRPWREPGPQHQMGGQVQDEGEADHHDAQPEHGGITVCGFS